jgi:hypothetical protein
MSESVKHSKLMADLWSKHAEVMEQLDAIEQQIKEASNETKLGEIQERPQMSRKVAKVSKVSGNGHKGRGRPKGSKNKPKTETEVQAQVVAKETEEKTESGKRFRNQASLKDLILKVAGQHDGVKLDDLVQECYDLGYRSTSDRKGFVQNIRTNLNTLINAGQIAKDEEKRYHIAAA